MSPPTFNLIDQPWIPVETADGPRRRSLLDTLHRSHTLGGISGDSPLTTAAVFRLLLAVLHAALRGPKSNRERLKLWREGRWDPDTITAYLRRWHDRFDLFHSEWPFYQCGGFEVAKPKSVAFIAPELASGNNATLFDHTLETDPPAIDPATAVLWLIRVQTFCLGGLDKSTSTLFGVSPSFYASPASQGAMVMPLGDNLFETLLFNLAPYDATRPFPTRPSTPKRVSRLPHVAQSHHSAGTGVHGGGRLDSSKSSHLAGMPDRSSDSGVGSVSCVAKFCKEQLSTTGVRRPIPLARRKCPLQFCG